MITLFALAAVAAEPVVPVDTGTSVRELVWAQPITLQAPHVASLRAGAPTVVAGVLLELRVDPELMMPSQLFEPVLYVGSSVAHKFNWDPVSGCAVVWASGPYDLATEPVFFGSLELPERVDHDRATAEVQAARDVGVLPMSSEQITRATQPSRELADFREVAALAQDRARACSGSDNDRQRGEHD